MIVDDILEAVRSLIISAPFSINGKSYAFTVVPEAPVLGPLLDASLKQPVITLQPGSSERNSAESMGTYDIETWPLHIRCGANDAVSQGAGVGVYSFSRQLCQLVDERLALAANERWGVGGVSKVVWLHRGPDENDADQGRHIWTCTWMIDSVGLQRWASM